MTIPQQRQMIIDLIEQAVSDGARRNKACECIGMSVRTLQRWYPKDKAYTAFDQRPHAKRSRPSHALTEQERASIIETANQPEYSSLPPSKIVPLLADKGQYLASESSFYRVLKAHDQLHHRGRSKAPTKQHQPVTHHAFAPNQVWMWDVTWLPSQVKGQYFYLYMVTDLYSRYGVTWEVHEIEAGQNAADLMHQAVIKHGLTNAPKPVLHSDNGSMMKSMTLKAKLESLGIQQSFSRPRVSNDNAYIESFFRTLKYVPHWPTKGFSDIDHARCWVQAFIDWYNEQHLHSQLKFVTPGQRYRGEDKAILAKRAQVYAQAKAQNPARWRGKVRNWTPISSVALNPDNLDAENSENIG